MSITPILLRSIPFDAKRLERIIENTLEEAAKNVKIDFGVTTRTWKKRPEFEIKKPKKFERTISTTNKIYYFISGGTRVRYATMVPGFRSKTVVRRITPRKGKGGVLFISRRIPRPGIEAREFPETIIKKEEKYYKRMFNTAIAAELARTL